jgi:hypothetical protein
MFFFTPCFKILAIYVLQTRCDAMWEMKKDYRLLFRNTKGRHQFRDLRTDGNITLKSMLGGSLVTTAWSVLKFLLEKTASRYGG